MEDAVRDGLRTVAEFVPKLALFLVILILGIIVAKVLAKALNAILERVGFDRAVERGGVKRALAGSTMDASDIVAKLIYYTLLLFVPLVVVRINDFVTGDAVHHYFRPGESGWDGGNTMFLEPGGTNVVHHYGYVGHNKVFSATAHFKELDRVNAGPVLV